ncbi:FAD-dependent oxidoreductase [Brevifollis gellanilyticus]|uniref:Nucleotide-disulfide oxidoreductase n=1 Tax=Brevifollis gellanilyticus TaxID=748831 RepID=A0A512MGI4_9BACT|nr:FAD-dependent oxidoreductase [Brevifollis gellanilyticus]GEP45816.1 nucleotide-disulfide oxidoreductase [Brevifollis gellanilyticus]
MIKPPDRTFDVAIIGGGFAGVYCAQALLKQMAGAGLRVGIIASENHMVFQPMLPEVAGGSLSAQHVVNPIRMICQEAEVLKGEVTSIDMPARVLTLTGGSFTPMVTVGFTHLMLAPGAGVDLSRIPGMSEHAFQMRTVGDAMKLRAAIIGRMEEANLLTHTADRKQLLSFVVVGGGYSGVETAGQIQDLIAGVLRYYENITPDEPSVTLVHSGERLLGMLSESLGTYTGDCLAKMGVKLIFKCRVRAVTARTVQLSDGSSQAASIVICTVGNAPHPLITTLGSAGSLPVEKGKIIVEPTGKVKGLGNVWSAGDCALFPKKDGGTCPETAQFAMRQGMVVGKNIAAELLHKPLKPFTFTGLGELATIGHRKAVAQIMGLRFSGIIAWFMWRGIYLMKLPGLDRKLRVMAEWTFELFFPRDINLLTPSFSSPLGEMHLEPGDTLFRSGEPAQSLYAVKKGRVDIRDAAGQLVKSAGPGEHFGERALLADGIWRFDAVATEPSELVAIDGGTFKTLVKSIGSLEMLFRSTAQQYHLPEEIQRTVNAIPAATRDGTAAEVMTRAVISLPSTLCVQDAITEFQAHPHSTYPVTDAEGKVTGLLRRSQAYEWLKNHGLTCQHTLAELPLTKPFCVSATMPVPVLIETLMRSGVSKALVVDEGQHLLGIVTLFDLLKGA